jgi:hypothetical protein
MAVAFETHRLKKKLLEIVIVLELIEAKLNKISCLHYRKDTESSILFSAINFNQQAFQGVNILLKLKIRLPFDMSNAKGCSQKASSSKKMKYE